MTHDQFKREVNSNKKSLTASKEELIALRSNQTTTYEGILSDVANGPNPAANRLELYSNRLVLNRAGKFFYPLISLAKNHYKHFLGGFAYHNLRQTNVFEYTVIDISKLSPFYLKVKEISLPNASSSLSDCLAMLGKEDNLHSCRRVLAQVTNVLLALIYLFNIVAIQTRSTTNIMLECMYQIFSYLDIDS
uniref:Uncharacterized protein n=1 Tax=Glossina pallidipes TaxID=7398 RepID=A0A1B0AB53_GLOPL